LTRLSEGCDFLVLFNIISGGEGVKGKVLPSSLLYPLWDGGCRGEGLHMETYIVGLMREGYRRIRYNVVVARDTAKQIAKKLHIANQIGMGGRAK
jgi:hypothetical protein